VANSKCVNNDWTTNKGCNFFCLTRLLSWKKKKRTPAVARGEEQATAMRATVLRLQAKNKAKRNHKLAQTQTRTLCLSIDQTFAGLHVRSDRAMKNETHLCKAAAQEMDRMAGWGHGLPDSCLLLERELRHMVWTQQSRARRLAVASFHSP
jgi:hypothetical protein